MFHRYAFLERSKNPLMSVRAMVLFLFFAAWISFGSGCSDDPCVKPYHCPPPDTVYDCMPVAKPSMSDLCYGECGDWIREHCPEVEWTY